MEREETIELVEKIENALANKDLDINEKYDIALVLYERIRQEKIDDLEGMNEEEVTEDELDEAFGDVEETEEEADEETEEDEDTETEEEPDEVEEEIEKELGAELKEPKDWRKQIAESKKKKKASLIKKPKIPIKK
jgi:hypothetical protein